MPECTPAITPPPFPMTARGQEPGWTLTIADGQIAHSGPYGADPIGAALPAPPRIGSGAGSGALRRAGRATKRYVGN